MMVCEQGLFSCRPQEPSRSERGEEETTESDSVEERRLQKFLALRRRREEDAQMRKQSSMTNSSGPSVSKRTVTPAGASAIRSVGEVGVQLAR